MTFDKVNFLCYIILVGLGQRHKAKCDNQAHFHFGTAEMLELQKRHKHVICDMYPYVNGDFKPSECYAKHD